ncbi:MAG: carboxypeptidase-like regulatory domain-containing protein [Bacteroidales bacterium]|nr:carboxypeptidase-like regulatory domain-containing protein [Bacteroidales bacterium]
MFQKIKEKKQQLIRFLFGSFTATALMFTFQACYGMPPQNDLDATIQGTVKSAETGEPIQGITVCGTRNDLFVQTGANGNFQLPVHFGSDQYLIHIKDEDGTENGSYQDLDTLLDASVLTDGVTILLEKRYDNQ